MPIPGASNMRARSSRYCWEFARMKKNPGSRISVFIRGFLDLQWSHRFGSIWIISWKGSRPRQKRGGKGTEKGRLAGWRLFDGGQRFDASQPKGRLACGSGLGQVHFEFGHPIVLLLRIHQHLLDAPGTLVFSRDHVGVPHVTGIRVEAEMRMFTLVGCHHVLQPECAPRLAMFIDRLDG